MTAPDEIGPKFRLAVVNTRADRDGQYVIRFDVPGPELAQLVGQACCRSCAAVAGPLRPGLADADVSVKVEHTTSCAGLLDFLGGRDTAAAADDGDQAQN